MRSTECSFATISDKVAAGHAKPAHVVQPCAVQRLPFSGTCIAVVPPSSTGVGGDECQQSRRRNAADDAEADDDDDDKQSRARVAAQTLIDRATNLAAASNTIESAQSTVSVCVQLYIFFP